MEGQEDEVKGRSRVEILEGVLRVASMCLLVVDSKRRDRFVTWSADTTAIVEATQAAIQEALAL